MTARLLLITALVLGAWTMALAQNGWAAGKTSGDDHGAGVEKVLYIWAQDEAHVAPDFLAVIDFDEAVSQIWTSHQRRTATAPRQYRQRTAPLPLEFDQDHPGMRGTAQPAEKSEWDFFL